MEANTFKPRGTWRPPTWRSALPGRSEHVLEGPITLHSLSYMLSHTTSYHIIHNIKYNIGYFLYLFFVFVELFECLSFVLLSCSCSSAVTPTYSVFRTKQQLSYLAAWCSQGDSQLKGCKLQPPKGPNRYITFIVCFMSSHPNCAPIGWNASPLRPNRKTAVWKLRWSGFNITSGHLLGQMYDMSQLRLLPHRPAPYDDSRDALGFRYPVFWGGAC